MLKNRFKYSIALIIIIYTIGITVIDWYNLEVYAQGSQNGTMNNISKAAPMANMSNSNIKDLVDNNYRLLWDYNI